MSVSLTISRPGRETEFVFMCGQRTAEEWVGEMARTHGFRILRGTYPAFMFEPGNLDQVIHEVGVLREEMFRWIDANQRLDQGDKACHRATWDTLLERLRQLKHEVGWRAYFG